jgi:hypothetical protein
MKRRVLIPAVLLATALVPACTNTQSETAQPVTVTLSLTDTVAPVNINMQSVIVITSVDVTSQFKSPTATNPQGFSDVQLTYYTVHYHRSDGGTRLPADQTFTVGQLLATPGSLTIASPTILSQAGLQGSPFMQFILNGGIDPETGSNQMTLFYDITVFGTTVSGTRVQSETVTGTKIFVFY